MVLVASTPLTIKGNRLTQVQKQLISAWMVTIMATSTGQFDIYESVTWWCLLSKLLWSCVLRMVCILYICVS